MALKFKYESKEQVPPNHLPFYAERDGAWVLDVEGAVEKSKLDEFRNSNVALLKERGWRGRRPGSSAKRFRIACGEDSFYAWPC